MRVQVLASVFSFLLLSFGSLTAQAPHAQQEREFHLPAATSEADYDKAYDLPAAAPLPPTKDHFMRRTVYGFHPGWNGSAYRSYDFGILPAIGYFGYMVDPATGSYKDLYFWKSSPLVQRAHEMGSAVDLVASLGSSADCKQLLNAPSSCNTLTDSLLFLIQARDADGICLDFEGLPAGQAENFLALVQQIRDSLDSQRPKAAITVTLPASDPDNAYDLPHLRDLVDRFIVKPYAAPGLEGPPLSVAGSEQALIHYQGKGLPKQQTLLAMPFWGHAPSAPTKTLSYRNFQQMGPDARSDVRIHQPESLEPVLDLVRNRNIQGVALWALGYDHGYEEFHNLLRDKFSQSEDESFGTVTAKEDLGLLGPDGGATKERNADNWMWMLGGCIFFIILLIFLKRVLK